MKPNDKDPLIEIAEYVGMLKAQVDKIDREMTEQKVPLETAARALDAALRTIEIVNSKVVATDLAKLGAQFADLCERVELLQRTHVELERESGRRVVEMRADIETRDARMAAALQERDRTAADQIAKLVAESQLAIAPIRAELERIDARITSLAVAEPRTLRPRGKWQEGAYATLDVVEFNGSSYVSNEDDNTERPGTGNKWTLLARRAASVGNGASSFEPTTLATLVDGPVVAWDLQTPVAQVTLGGDRTLSVANMRAGATTMLKVTQDATGGRTLSWPSVVLWPEGVTPALSSTAGATDIFSFASDGVVLYGSYAKGYVAP